MPHAHVVVDSSAATNAALDVHYTAHGTGRTLVALHGWTLDHRAQEASLEPVFETRPGWRRIYPDLPGHGNTPAPSWISTHHDMFAVVAAFIDAVAPRERICLAGQSYGCALICRVVEQRGTDIDGLLYVVPPTDDDEIEPFRVRHEDPDFVAALRPEERHQLEFVVWQDVRVLDQIRARFDTGAAVADHAFLERLGGPAHVVPLERTPYPGPALIVTGRNDNWCGYRRMFRLLDDYPLATFAALDGAGHALMIEREPLFRALVADWADRVESGNQRPLPSISSIR